MSRASKITLGVTTLVTAATITMVHFQQKFEKDAMHQGVVRDMEQQRIKRERQLDFEMQKALEAEYKKEQNVTTSTAAAMTTTTPSGAAQPGGAA